MAWNLAAVRSFNVDDPLPPLGKKVTPTAPAPTKTVSTPTGTPGVFRGPDGKLHTVIPENDAVKVVPAEPKHVDVCVGYGATPEALEIYRAMVARWRERAAEPYGFGPTAERLLSSWDGYK